MSSENSDVCTSSNIRGHGSVNPVACREFFTFVRAYRGEVDEAFAWLDRAYAQKDVGLYLLRGDLLLSNLVADPRYKAFLLKMKLKD